MPNIYLIRQDTTYLYGDVLDTAIVVADSIPSARQSLSSHLVKSSEITPLTWDKELWSITKIGNNGKYLVSDNVLCRSILSRDQLPIGNYKPNKKDIRWQ